MIDVAVLRAMAEAGASVDVIIAAVDAAQAAEVRALEEKRAKDAARKRKSRATSDMSRGQPVTERDVHGQSVTARDGCDTPSSPASPSSSPLTLPLITTPSPSPSPSASLRSAAAPKRAARLAEDWKPSEDDFEYAHQKGVSHARIAIEAEKFRNYWTAKSGKDATKTADVGWPRTWQNWILNMLEREGKSNANGRRSVQDAADDLVERVQALVGSTTPNLGDETGARDVRLLPAR